MQRSTSHIRPPRMPPESTLACTLASGAASIVRIAASSIAERVA